MATLQVFGATASFLTLLALSRLLSPRDFGIAAVAALVTGIIGTFGDFGLGPAVIQRKNRVEDALHTGATLRLVISLILFGVTLLIAPFAASFLSTPEATEPIRVVAILFVLNGAAFVPVTWLTKELKFGLILRAAAASTIASAVTSVTLAYSGFGYWSIVFGSLVAAVVYLLAFFVLQPWRLGFLYDSQIARELVGYGKHLFLMSVFVFFVLNIDDAAIAYALGTAALGYYTLAFKWAGVPVNFLSKVAAQVMMPTYVFLRDSVDRLRKAYLETIQMVVIVSLPIYVGLLILADEFVLFVLGPVWLPIVVPLRILCVLGLLRAITEPGGYVFMAIGRSKLMSVSTGLHLAFVGVFLYPGLALGAIAGVAAAVVVAYGLNTIVVQYFVKRHLGVVWSEIGRLLRGASVAGLAMATVVLGVKLSLPSSGVTFLLAVGGGLAMYLAALHRLERGLLSRYLRQVLEARRVAKSEGAFCDSRKGNDRQ